MDLKATVYGTLCLTALSLCLCLAGGCGPNIPPPLPGKSPGFFGDDKGRGAYRSNDALLKEYYAKKKAKARTKPKAK